MRTIEKDNYVYFIKLNDEATIPTKGSPFSAGYDLYSASTYDIEIKPHTTVKIGTGLAMELPVNTFGGIFARSGIATKRGLRPSNCTGVIDSDYRGEIIVALHNDTDEVQVVAAKERIAQLIVIPFLPITLVEAKVLNSTERGQGGFGSSGTN